MTIPTSTLENHLQPSICVWQHRVARMRRWAKACGGNKRPLLLGVQAGWMACDLEHGQSIIRGRCEGGGTIRDPTMEQEDTFNIVSRRQYLSRCDQTPEEGKQRKTKTVGRMIIVLQARDLLIYYLDRRTRTSSSADLVWVEYNSSGMVIRWKWDEEKCGDYGAIVLMISLTEFTLLPGSGKFTSSFFFAWSSSKTRESVQLLEN